MQAFLDATVTTLRANKSSAEKAVAQVSDEQLHVALDPHTNCLAVIMKHIAGNLISRWTDFLTTDGEKPWRNRDGEFIDTFTDRAELLAYWESGWQHFFDALASLTPADYDTTIYVRGEPHSIPLAIQRSLTHTVYHVGQIVLVARVLAGDKWNTITIPRGGSEQYNKQVWGKGHYQPPVSK